MTPIQIKFRDGVEIQVFSADPQKFVDSVMETSPPEVLEMTYSEHISVDESEVHEASISLHSGHVILCNMKASDIHKVSRLTTVSGCERTFFHSYAKMNKDEAELDQRFQSACLVINNIPDIPTRHNLHQAYIKRKRAYVAALEALVDGVIRRPTE